VFVAVILIEVCAHGSREFGVRQNRCSL